MVERSTSDANKDFITDNQAEVGVCRTVRSGETAGDDNSDAGPSAALVRLLVMDDEEMIRDLAVAMFGRYGIEVDVAEDGPGTVGLFEEARNAGRPYAAVVLDLRIPGGIGGREVVGLLKEIDSSVQVAAASGDGLDPVLVDFSGHGFDAAIAKPYTIGQIQTLLGELGLIASRTASRRESDVNV